MSWFVWFILKYFQQKGSLQYSLVFFVLAPCFETTSVLKQNPSSATEQESEKYFNVSYLHMRFRSPATETARLMLLSKMLRELRCK